MPRGCVPRIRIWPPKREERSCFLLGAGGIRRSDWPKCVWAVDVVVGAERQELKCSRLAPGYFTLNGDKAPPAARDSSEVARS